MKGIIIAGGFGTRLRPLTLHRPKHLLPVANRPFLEYQVALLKRHGIGEIIFASNYLSEQIEAHFGDGSRFGVAMQYALESTPLGTAGAIRNAAERASGERVVVLNGDILTDFDIGSVVEFHQKRRADATIAVRSVQRPHGFGILDSDSDGRVREWREPTEEEKKRIAAAGGASTGESDFINAGIYVLEPGFMERIPAGRAVSIERETYPLAIADGCRVFATAPDGFWLDIGNPRQYLAANAAVLSGRVRTDVSYRQIAESAQIDGSASVDEESAIGPDCVIGPDAVIQRSVLLDGVRAGASAKVIGAVLDSNSEVGAGCVVAEGIVLEAGARGESNH